MIRREALVVLLGAVALVGACDKENFILTPGVLNQMFRATLTPAAEVPPVTGVSSTGSSTLTVIDTNTIRVETNVANIDSVTQAHIHAGDATVAGPIMVFLTPTYALVRGQRVARHLPDSVTIINGALSHIDITRGSAFTAPYTFDSVLVRVRNGTAYVNVHTRKNPGGEIRGQVTPQ
jgi:hypothetical protein